MPIIKPKLVIDLTILTILALAARLIGLGIDHPPVGDEMFHVLAARSWVNDGSLSIADGVYTRSALFTQFVGFLFWAFGESLVVARLPAFVFGVLWVLLLYLWMINHTSRFAALVAALLFCFAPHAIELSLYSRMYTLHGFLFLMACIGIFKLMDSKISLSQSLFIGLVSMICLGISFHLHDITLIGIGALMVSISLDVLIRNRTSLRSKHRVIPFILLVLLIAVISITVLFLNWELFSGYWNKFTNSAFAQRSIGVTYYHKLLINSYPVLWLLFPIASILAIYANPRIGTFCVAMFVLIFLTHSLAGRKAERYIYYGMPFLFAIWGMAIAKLLPHLDQLLSDMAKALRSRYFPLGREDRFSFIFKFGITCVGIVFMLSGSGAFARTIHLFNGESYYFGVSLANWELVVPKLAPIIKAAPVVVTSNFPKTQYYFKRFDFVLSPVIVEDIVAGKEGGIDRRTGRPAISTVESVQRIFEQYPHGVFVGETGEWRSRLRVNNVTADFIEKHTVKLDLPKNSKVVAYTW